MEGSSRGISEGNCLGISEGNHGKFFEGIREILFWNESLEESLK